MRKIAFINANEYVPWGGSENCWAAAAERLARRGVQVCVSVLDWGVPVKQIENLRSAGCRILYRPKPSLLSRARRKFFPGRDYARNVREVGAGADLTVVSQGDNLQGLLWMEALRSTAYKYATIVQGASETKWPEDGLIERLAEAYEAASAVYFVSEATLSLNSPPVRYDTFTSASDPESFQCKLRSSSSLAV